MKCPWVYGANENLIKYHDEVWCKEIHDEQELFKRLCLLTFQCGLKWEMILDKQSILEEQFENFVPEKLVTLNLEQDFVINNPRKINAVIHNAQTLLKLHATGHSLDELVWKNTNYRTINNEWTKVEQIPCESALSKVVAKKFRQANFCFVGPKSMYSYLQMVGVINDHLVTCENKFVDKL